MSTPDWDVDDGRPRGVRYWAAMASRGIMGGSAVFVCRECESRKSPLDFLLCCLSLTQSRDAVGEHEIRRCVPLDFGPWGSLSVQFGWLASTAQRIEDAREEWDLITKHRERGVFAVIPRGM